MPTCAIPAPICPAPTTRMCLMDMRGFVGAASVPINRLERLLTFEVLLVREQTPFQGVLHLVATAPRLLAPGAHQPGSIVTHAQGGCPLDRLARLVGFPLAGQRDREP